MTTTTIYRKSHDWDETIYQTETWGSETTQEEAQKLGQAVVDRFHGLCATAGRDDIVWYPRLGEVHGNNDDAGLPEVDLDALREQAGDEVVNSPERYLEA
jgi:hypothetical protein